ncbi:imidazole glycerol phosphate synthase subunit HisF [Xanthomonas oryzae pv. oryzae]|nr:imidazole glycerol phosphate synthase subunit HisF [Xanthomonas oryzae pv. oryzae]
MLSRRIIPCLDVRNGRVVKGVKFHDHIDMGDIVELALRYRAQGADELVFYDIGASPEGRSVDYTWVERVARLIDIPFCVAGGIGDVETARAVLHAGADKISINSPALGRPQLISELADAFGVQCVVVGIDSIREDDGQWRVRRYTGDPSKTQALPMRTLDWVAEAQRLGAGEIVLNCMDNDGVRRGYDIAQLRQVRALCHVPLIASGVRVRCSIFADVFDQADVDGALAASVFHSGAIPIPELKQFFCARNRSRYAMGSNDVATGDALVTLDWSKGDGLLPVIVQDADNLRVLMLGYMNAEALAATQQRGEVTFFSRSKQRLWTKGESSGNVLRVVSIETDCDADTLLVQARPHGPTCHLGRTSCFSQCARAVPG